MISWWYLLQNEDQYSIFEAFDAVAKESKEWCPTAVQLLDHVKAISKTRQTIKREPLGSDRALPEPELTLDPSNPLYEALENIKAGRLRGKDAIKEIVQGITKSTAMRG
jgi:hypothetical protein